MARAEKLMALQTRLAALWRLIPCLFPRGIPLAHVPALAGFLMHLTPCRSNAEYNETAGCRLTLSNAAAEMTKRKWKAMTNNGQSRRQSCKAVT